MSIQVIKNNLAKPQDPLIFKEIPGIEENGKTIRKMKNEDFAGSYCLMFFFPLGQKTHSEEVLKFSSSLQEFSNLGCRVIGVTSESPLAITRWMEKETETGGFGRLIGFPVLSDKDLTLSASLGVARNCGLPAKSTFIIDPEGKIRYSGIQHTSIPHNIPELIRLVKAFKKSDETGKAAPAGWQSDESDLVPTDYNKKVAYFNKKYGNSGVDQSIKSSTGSSVSSTKAQIEDSSVGTIESGSTILTSKSSAILFQNLYLDMKQTPAPQAHLYNPRNQVQDRILKSGMISKRLRRIFRSWSLT